MASALTPNHQWKALIMVRALDPAVVSVLWQAIYHHLPEHVDDHPLGCHRKRVSDLLCFRGILRVKVRAGVVVMGAMNWRWVMLWP